MAVIHFTRALNRFHEAPTCDVAGQTLRDALENVFATRPALRSYVLDDQGAIRKHVAIFINGRSAMDRQHLSDPIEHNDEIHVFQALTGG